jgi:hypothetical protein
VLHQDKVRARPRSVGSQHAPQVDLPAPEPEPPAPEPAQGAPTARAAIEGVIVDPDGRPAPDVSVRAHFARRGADCFDRSCGDAAAHTDTAGRFTLAVPRGAQWAVVGVDAPGFVPPETRMVRGYGTTLLRAPSDDVVAGIGRRSEVAADARILGLRDEPAWPHLKVVLERGKPVAGVVERAVGVVAPGVEVQCLWDDGAGAMRIARSRTDERGWFSVTVPVPVFVQVTSHDDEGYRLVAMQGPVPPGASGLRLLLSTVVPVNVRLHTPEGLLSGGLNVCLSPVAVRGFKTSPSYEYVDVETERLAIGWQPPGEYEIEAAPTDAPYLPARGRATIPGPPVDLHLPRAVRIEGLLEGEGLKGFEITWTGPCNPSFKCQDYAFRSDEAAPQYGRTVRIRGDRGAFLFEAVGEGDGEVYARREGDPRCAFVARYGPSHGFLRLTLSEGASVKGRVQAPVRAKLDRLRVRAVRGLAAQSAVVREDGTFAIVGLPPGPFRVELVSGGFPIREWIHDTQEGVEAGSENVVLRVRLPSTDPGDGS